MPNSSGTCQQSFFNHLIVTNNRNSNIAKAVPIYLSITFEKAKIILITINFRSLCSYTGNEIVFLVLNALLFIERQQQGTRLMHKNSALIRTIIVPFVLF